MGPGQRTQRIAAYGGGGLGGALGLGVGATVYGLTVSQSRLARRRIPAPESDPPAAHDTVWALRPDVPVDRDPITVAWLGDSWRPVMACHRDVDTPAAVRSARPVRLSPISPCGSRSVAVVGSESAELGEQVARLSEPPDIAVIVIWRQRRDPSGQAQRRGSPSRGRGAGLSRAMAAEVVVGYLP